MTEPATPPASDDGFSFKDVFSQANITTALAVFAAILAVAPYVTPRLQTYIVEKGLMAQPAMLEAANDKLNAQKRAEAAQTSAEAILAPHDSIFNDKLDPVIGNPKAPIKVVEFLDYQCAYCRAATPFVKDFLAANPDVQLVVKEYPVVHGQSSFVLAAYGMAANQQGHYDAVHYAFLTQTLHNQADLEALLTKAGLDVNAATTAAKTPAISDHINKTVALGTDLNITGTPTFIVGDQMVDGADMNALATAVAATRAKKS